MGGRTIPQFGVHYEPTELSRSNLSLDLLPLINSRAVGLLDHERMMMQLVSLERTSVRGGRDRMDNPVANAAAGAMVHAHKGSAYSPVQQARDNAYLSPETGVSRGRLLEEGANDYNYLIASRRHALPRAHWLTNAASRKWGAG